MLKIIHYHGTPCSGTKEQAAKFMMNRHILIPFIRPDDLGIAMEVCESFCVDSGAYTAWKKNIVIEWDKYYAFVDRVRKHPSFDWAIVPDVIDGTDLENDRLIDEWELVFGTDFGVPVWHMHEPLERLRRLCQSWPRVALGSSGEFAIVGTRKWWVRMSSAMDLICIGGAPMSKLHGLRMLDPDVFTRLPLASADSTNAVRNCSNIGRFGMYKPPNSSTRMHVIAERVEAFQSAHIWKGYRK